MTVDAFTHALLDCGLIYRFDMTWYTKAAKIISYMYLHTTPGPLYNVLLLTSHTESIKPQSESMCMGDMPTLPTL